MKDSRLLPCLSEICGAERHHAWPGIKQHRMGGEELDPREDRSWDPGRRVAAPGCWSMNSRGR